MLHVRTMTYSRSGILKQIKWEKHYSPTDLIKKATNPMQSISKKKKSILSRATLIIPRHTRASM